MTRGLDWLACVLSLAFVAGLLWLVIGPVVLVVCGMYWVAKQVKGVEA